MNHFEYRNGEMYAEGVAVKRIAREVGGTVSDDPDAWHGRCYSTARMYG